MRRLLTVVLILSAVAYCGCDSNTSRTDNIHGTWQSLWEKDIKLQLQLNDNGRFKVTLTRIGQVHNNLGWYSIEDGIFIIRDSVDYPLPVCNTVDTGKYSFRIHQDTLQFKVVEDKCERRSTALQLERFVRVN